MKKAYKAPISRTFDLQPECCFLTASSVNTLSVKDTSVGASSGLSNKKSIWGSSSWSNTGE